VTPPSTGRLFLLAVLIWGTTWHAIVYQLAAGSPAFGVTLRFAIAGVLALGIAAARGDTLRLPVRAHGRLALQGAFMYSLSYLCVYHAELHVPSGLVAVGYSASPLLAGLASRALWGTPVTRRFLVGGVLGVAGVAVIFWPEVGASGARPQAALGLAFTVAAVLLSAIGSLAASRNGALGLAFWPALGFSMLYGAALSSVGLAGEPIVWPAALSWWVSLAYLSLAGSLLAFAAFLTLQQRVGPGRAATIGVMTPVVALAVSTAFEGYRPGWLTLAGVLLAVAGNRLMLTDGRAVRGGARAAE
jgi:drug/metabolite transporter (DMT)-like permease